MSEFAPPFTPGPDHIPTARERHQQRLADDPDYALEDAENRYKESVDALEKLVVDHVGELYDNNAVPSAFMDSLKQQTKDVERCFQRVRDCITRINRRDNPEWF